MDLSVVISRLASKYKVLNILSGVEAGSQVERDAKPYQKIIGPLSGRELESISQYKIWFSKYHNHKVRLLFFGTDDGKEILKKLPDSEVVKKIFSEFDEPFERLWQSELTRLQGFKKIIETDYSLRSTDMRSSLKILSNLFSKYDPKLPKQIAIYLIPLPAVEGKFGVHSGHTIGQGKICFEINSLDNEPLLRRLWLLFLHEVAHSNFETSGYKRWIKGFIESKTPVMTSVQSKTELVTLMREAILNSLVPRGYLAAKLYRFDILKEEKRCWRECLARRATNNSRCFKSFVVQEMFQIAKKYVEDSRPLDESYLNEAWKTVVNYKKIAPKGD